jgi:aspartyl-tRNA(Asn)/glutamyl-tRNA(Gln) amidotransferase subunit A
LGAYHSFEAIKKDLAEGRITCQELVKQYLTRIKEKSHLNAFLEVYDEEALEKAAEVDQKIKAGTAGRLAGMVVGIKDLLCHKDHGLQGGSKILDGFKSQFSATAVQRLVDEDAIIIGRQNCDEFGMGSSNENSAFGPVLNDADNTRVPGGSSGGSAVAVQADLCLASLGTDTGGSVRLPAAFCGIVGLKPTYSRISRFGLAAYASSFDCIGIFAKTIEDTALVLEIIAGADEYDSTVSQREVPAYSALLNKPGKLKVAYVDHTENEESISPAIRKSIAQKIDFLKAEGHTVKNIDLPLIDYLLPTYYILTTAEASSNLSRYDGVKYGYRTPGANDLETMYKKTRTEGFGEEVKRRIMLGTFVLSASYYDAFYTKAQKVRRLIKEKTEEILKEYDFIILPTTSGTAFKLGENTQDPIAMYLTDLFTVQASVAGLPAISIPTGTDSDNLPVGIQIMTSAFQEDKLLAFSKYLMTDD